MPRWSRVLGGLNLYSTTSDEFDPEAEATAELFAAHAAIALHNARERENLNEALRRGGAASPLRCCTLPVDSTGHLVSMR